MIRPALQPDAALQLILQKLDELAAGKAVPAPRFFSVADAAGYTSLSSDSIRRLLESGRLTALRPVKGKILIDRRELEHVVLGSTDRPAAGRGVRPGHPNKKPLPGRQAESRG